MGTTCHLYTDSKGQGVEGSLGPSPRRPSPGGKKQAWDLISGKLGSCRAAAGCLFPKTGSIVFEFSFRRWGEKGV